MKSVYLLSTLAVIALGSKQINLQQVEEDEDWDALQMSPNPQRRRLAFDIAVIAAWTSTLSVLGSWGSISGYGGNIHIQNHLCHNLAYNGMSVLTHGSWKSHCDMVLGGSDDGCQLNGVWNRGSEGMLQYEVEGTGWAINLYFRVSAGWGKENRIHAFWTRDIVSKADDLYESGCWYDHCEAHTDAQLDCYKWYRGECTANHEKYPILGREGSVEVRYNVGSGNNPDIKLEFRSNILSDPDGQCNPFKPNAKVVDENVDGQDMMVAVRDDDDEDDDLSSLTQDEQDRINMYLQLNAEQADAGSSSSANAMPDNEDEPIDVDQSVDDSAALTEEEQARIREFVEKLQHEKENGQNAQVSMAISERETEVHDMMNHLWEEHEEEVAKAQAQTVDAAAQAGASSMDMVWLVVCFAVVALIALGVGTYIGFKVGNPTQVGLEKIDHDV